MILGPDVPRYDSNGVTILADAVSSAGPDGLLVDGLVKVHPGDPRYQDLASTIAARELAR